MCVFVTGLVCTAAYVGMYGWQQRMSVRVGVQVAALATALLTALRNSLLQLKYQVWCISCAEGGNGCFEHV